MSTPSQINAQIDQHIQNDPSVPLRGGIHNTILKMITGSYYNKDMDSILFKLIHNPSRVYKKDEAAIYGNTLYVANEDNITGAWNATKWTSYLDLNPGAAFGITKYASGTSFLIGNYTEYQNEIYRAKTEVQGIPPDPTQETAQWVKVPHKFKTCDEWRAGLYLDGSVFKKDGKLYEVTLSSGTYFESAVFATDLGDGKITVLSGGDTGSSDHPPKFTELASPATEGTIDYAANATTGDLYVNPFNSTNNLAFAGTNIAEGYSVYLAVTMQPGHTLSLDPSFELIRGSLNQEDVNYLKLTRYPTVSGGDLIAEVIEEADAQAPVNSSPIDAVDSDFQLDITDPDNVILKLATAVKDSLAKAESALQEIADGSITGSKLVAKTIDFSRIADIATGRLLGRIDLTSGVIQQLTKDQSRTFIGINEQDVITPDDITGVNYNMSGKRVNITVGIDSTYVIQLGYISANSKPFQYVQNGDGLITLDIDTAVWLDLRSGTFEASNPTTRFKGDYIEVGYYGSVDIGGTPTTVFWYYRPFTNTDTLYPTQAEIDSLTVGEKNLTTIEKKAGGDIELGAGIGLVNLNAPPALSASLGDDQAWVNNMITLNGDNTTGQLGKNTQRIVYGRRLAYCTTSTESSATYVRGTRDVMLDDSITHDAAIIAELETETGWLDNVKTITTRSVTGDIYTTDTGYQYVCYAEYKWRRIGQPTTKTARIQNAGDFTTLCTNLLAHDFATNGAYDAIALTYPGSQLQYFFDEATGRKFECVIANGTKVLWVEVQTIKP